MKKLPLLATLLLVSCGAEVVTVTETITVKCRDEIKRIQVDEKDLTLGIERNSWYLDTIEICE